MVGVTISKVTPDGVNEVVALFDAYRLFYDQVANLNGARDFLTEGLVKGESVVLLAKEDGKALGFVQLYPSFSSISMGRIWILNDLFVTPSARGRGVGAALLKASEQLAVETGAKELILETMKTNLTAQRLYELTGRKRDEIFYRYFLSVGPNHLI
jgi:GNAT superfamily N-acetyltransferase